MHFHFFTFLSERSFSPKRCIGINKILWLINKSTHTHFQGEIRAFYIPLYHVRIPSELIKYFCLGFVLYYFSEKHVRNKYRCDSEASYTVTFIFFSHKSAWHKMLLKFSSEVKCQMYLKDTQSEGFCVSWIMYVEYEWWIKSFSIHDGKGFQTWVLPLSHRGNLSNNCDPFLRLHCSLKDDQGQENSINGCLSLSDNQIVLNQTASGFVFLIKGC